MSLIKSFISSFGIGATTMLMLGQSTANPIELPWLTGPLLAPAGHTVPAGHTNWEPYVFVNDQFGHYGSNWQATRVPTEVSTTPQLVVTRGLTKNMDVETIIPYLFNSSNGRSYDGFGDIQLMLGFQALEDKVGGWRPDLRITVGETFPSGRYQNFSADRSQVEQTGAGSYQTTFATNFQKTIRLGERFLRARLSVAYTIPAAVNVSGINVYGGGVDTQATVNPGKVLSVDAGLEFTLTQHWVPAIDVVYTTSNRATFKGRAGTDARGLPAQLGGGSAAEFSMAPAIEYNFTPAFGVVAGAWFSFEGENSTEFTAMVVAVNYYV